jgi:hypothetical protein
MSSESPKNIRQVQLPSGKIIEVLYFAGQQDPALEGDISLDPAPAAQPAGAPVRPDEDLHVCPRCTGELVYPVDWAEAGPKHWEVALRCPDCEWGDVGIFTQEAVERFDLELDRGAEVLLRDLQQLARANMADDVERFIVALRDDHIVPTDF